MTIKWKISTLLGMIVALSTYFFSYANNTWIMSLFWAVLGFLFFFIIGVLFQTLLKHFNKSKPANKVERKEELDLVKIQERQNLGDSIEETEFQGIPLTALHQSGEMQDSEKIANTIRSWTE